MTAATADTIAAIATPPGRGAVGIVRIAGPAAASIAAALTGACPPPRTATVAAVTDAAGRAVDECIALFFPAPASYTGDDVVELHTHGAPVVLDQVVARAIALGARAARPGEFTERAFLNGKLDLAQAEAVADLINAGTEAAARSAASALGGALSKRVNAIAAALTDVRVAVEASLDFPDEAPEAKTVAADVQTAAAKVEALINSARQGQLLRDGMTVALAGAPNAGKSSLLNALAGRDRAIVSGEPGTTRDVVDADISVDGMPLRVVDTAGLRTDAAGVEAEGVRRATKAMAGADRVLLVCDDADPGAEAPAMVRRRLPADASVTLVWNKIDLSGRAAGMVDADAAAVSAKTGAGLGALRGHLKQCMGFRGAEDSPFLARRRHLDALGRCRDSLRAAGAVLTDGGGVELAAEDLRLAHRALGEITGAVGSEELLGKIFAEFCIGK